MQAMKSKYAVILIALIATACSTTKPGTPEFVAKQEDERQKAAVKSVDQSISKMPSWYTQPPVDANALYAAASESSPDMQMSRMPRFFPPSVSLPIRWVRMSLNL